MNISKNQVVVGVLAILLCGGTVVFAQQASGSISGVVQDAQGALVPGAKVTLLNQTQGSTYGQMNTTTDGTFVFQPLPPATYTVTVEANGFKKYTKTDVVLFANDRMGLPVITLDVGVGTETVTVEANAQALETVTAARSGIITGSQVVDLGLNGRSFTTLMKTAPGVTNDGTNAIGGQRTDQYTYTLDGTTMEDSGCGCFAFTYSVDAIAEVKIQTNALTAEFGHSAGPQVTVVTKSGTRDFHGTGYWFHRNEGMNASSFTNNYSGIARPIYRYLTAGFNVSGPVYIPKHVNANREKLFFFVMQEWNHSKAPASLYELTMPSLQERQGNFSDALNASRVLQIVDDPANGKAPFPNNIIPANRFNSYGEALLNWLPTPNTAPTATYNWISQIPASSPSLQQMYKLDYNITDKVRLALRGYHYTNTQTNPYGGLASGNDLGDTFIAADGAWSFNADLVWVVTPTLTNDFQYGNTRNYLPVLAPAGSSNLLLSNASGTNIPLLYPQADKASGYMVPNISIGANPIPNGTNNLQTDTVGNNNSAFSAWGSLPYANENPTINYTDNVSKVFGDHILKAGIFYETATKTQSPYADTPGTLIFDQSSSNPGDTGWPYATALLGNYTAFTQISNYEVAHYAYNQTEWYIQDTWKVKPNFTLNYGLRFSVMGRLHETGGLVSSFVPSDYNPAQAVSFWQPTCLNGAAAPCSGTNRGAKNPLTGATAGTAFIGAIASGNINNGMETEGTGSEPVGLVNQRGVQFGPRLGFAWQPFGNSSKTVIRAGAGVFYERIQGNYLYYQITNPPVLRESEIWNSTISSIGSTQLTNFPVNVGGVSGDGKVPTVYNYNFGIQQQLPQGFLLDVSYVGSISRHGTLLVPFNDVPLGAAWLPQNQDPTLCPNTATCNLNGANALPAAFYRPYLGYNGSAGGGSGSAANAQGALYNFGSSASYNALQASINRRMAKRLQVGASFTWGKALGVQSSTTTNEPLPTGLRQDMYGPLSFDRTLSLTINYLYDFPDGAKKGTFLDNFAGKFLLNGWQFSGITSLTGGAPINPTYSISCAAVGYFCNSAGSTVSGSTLNNETTGSYDIAPRPVFTCNPFNGGGSQLEYINTSCITFANKGSAGNDSGYDRLRGPGYNDWDMSIFKRIKYLGEGETRYIQLRLEAFNAINNVQWGTINTSAIISSTTGQVTNTPTALGGTGGRFGFGAENTVRSNSQRILQIAVKLYF
jgi:hypothetical protein